MTDFEARLQAEMESAVASEQPPGNLIAAVRRRHRQHLRRVAVAGVASAVVAVSVAAALPAGIGAAGHGRAGEHRRAASTVYVEFEQKLTGLIVPISAATNRPGKPIHTGGSMALAPDGKTLYVSPGAVTIPVSTATNKPGKRIRVGGYLTIDPNGKTAYAIAPFTSRVTPVNLVTRKPGKPIHLSCLPGVIAFTPDGKTVYVGTIGTVIPISTATGTPGKPILTGVGSTIAITPDGKTVYAAAQNKVVPISTATNRPGKPIRLPYGFPGGILTTP